MTQQLLRPTSAAADGGRTRGRARTTLAAVRRRRLVALLLVAVPLIWSAHRAVAGGGGLVNRGGLALLDDLLGRALRPALDPTFLALVLDAAVLTVVFAALGTALALVIGAFGGVVLADVTWARRPPAPVRLLRLALRGLLVAARSIHELVWALLLVSVLGLDPLVGVLAIAVPFGAQTAKIFAETLDGVPSGPLLALRHAGARRLPALAYALLPGAGPLLLSYSFYRFECAIRSAVLLGVVGLGGLGQELVVSLQSRNWEEVWTLVGAVVVLSAVVDLWSTRLRGDMAVVSCSDWSVGYETRDPERVPLAGRRARSSRWARGSLAVVLPGLAVAWWSSDVSLAGLTSPRTRELTGRLLEDLWPPALPAGGWDVVGGAVADTVAMAVLAMAVAVLITLLVAPLATARRSGVTGSGGGVDRSLVARATRAVTWASARALLVVLRSVPPTVWAIVALLALFPGILPGALALGLYTGGILGRLVAEAWESVDVRPRDSLCRGGVAGPVAALAAVTPASAHHLLTYTLYRLEICVRDTAVVGVVGAAGLGRLLAENLSTFRFPVVTTVLIASFALSVATEVLGRWLRSRARS